MAYTLGEHLDATFTVLDDAATPVLGLVPTTIIARDPDGAAITFTYDEVGNGIYTAISDQPAARYGLHFLHISANDAEGQIFRAVWDVDPPETVIVANQMAQQVLRPVLSDADGTFDSRYLKKDGPIPAIKVMDVLALTTELPLVGEDGEGYIVGSDFYVWGAANDWVNAGSFSGKSAYAVALANGFVGTEAEWLQSLVGPDPIGEVIPDAVLILDGTLVGSTTTGTVTGTLEAS